MEAQDLAELCAEYRRRITERARGWKIKYVGPIEHLPGGAQHHGIKPGHLCVLASKTSDAFHEPLTVCFGIGEPDGPKLEPPDLANQLDGAMIYAEAQRKRHREQLSGR